MLQELIQNTDLRIKDVSLGTSFGLIQDKNLLTYQIGSLFSENKNSINFQFLDNIKVDSFSCVHDFVVATVANTANQKIYSPNQLQRSQKRG